jgi:4-hydroxybenzoate polyprenyltransferase
MQHPCDLPVLIAKLTALRIRRVGGCFKNMSPDTSGNTGATKSPAYSYSSLVKDVFIVLLAALPEAAQRTALLFTDKPLIPWLQERGVSVSWFLILTVPLALLVFYKQHRTKAKNEATFLYKRFPKNAPVLLFVFIFGFFYWF